MWKNSRNMKDKMKPFLEVPGQREYRYAFPSAHRHSERNSYVIYAGAEAEIFFPRDLIRCRWMEKPFLRVLYHERRQFVPVMMGMLMA